MEIYLRSLIGLILVCGLILCFAWLAKWWEKKRGLPLRSYQKTLSILESLTLDSKRKLLLIQHHQKTHLLLLSQHGDLVISSDDSPAKEE